MTAHPAQLAHDDQRRADAAESAAVLVELQRLWAEGDRVGYSPLVTGALVGMCEHDVRRLLLGAVDIAARKQVA